MKKLALAISLALISGSTLAAADMIIDNVTVNNKDTLAADINTLYSSEISAKQLNPEDNVSLVTLSDSSANQISNQQNSAGFDQHLSVVDLSAGSDSNAISVTQSDSFNTSLVKGSGSSANTITVAQTASSNESIVLMDNADNLDASITQTGSGNFAGLELNNYGSDNHGGRNSIEILQASENDAFVEVDGNGHAHGDTIFIQQEGTLATADVFIRGSSLNNDIAITQMDSDQAYVEVTGSSWNNTITVDQEADNKALVTVHHSDRNTVLVDQDGSFNTATVTISRPYTGTNTVDIIQTGDFNDATASVSVGTHNDIDVVQSGDNNLADVLIQNGSRNKVLVTQNFDTNIADVSITDGGFNEVSVTQDWNSEALVTLAGSSNNNVAGLSGQPGVGIEIVQADNELAIVNLTNSNGNAIYISQDNY